jgi:hypothetical protein
MDQSSRKKHSSSTVSSTQTKTQFSMHLLLILDLQRTIVILFIGFVFLYLSSSRTFFKPTEHCSVPVFPSFSFFSLFWQVFIIIFCA